jgi:hypothetical protein
VLIDDEDIPIVKANVPWGVRKKDNRVYFINRNRGLHLHRLIRPCPDGLETDHAKHNYLDLRKSELRCATHAENARNARKQVGTSRFKGVTWHKATGKWKAQVMHNRKNHYLGLCPGTEAGEIECAKRYKAKASELFGEYAHSNLPEQGE